MCFGGQADCVARAHHPEMLIKPLPGEPSCKVGTLGPRVWLSCTSVSWSSLLRSLPFLCQGRSASSPRAVMRQLIELN